MKQILVRSYRTMCGIAQAIMYPHIVIRFGETQNVMASPFDENELRKGECGIQVYDCERVTQVDKGMEQYVFNREHAVKILRFVETYSEIEYIFVHCHAGISRSAGCAAALAKIYNGDDSKYFLIYVPNMLIYDTLLRTYYEEQDKLCLQI